MKKTKSLLAALALTLSLTAADAITFTTHTAIGAGDTTHDGQDIVVQGCTLTVDGPHAFASLTVTNGGVVTHSPAPNGEANNRVELTIAGDVTVDASSAIQSDGRGYGAGSGPGAGIHASWSMWFAGSGAGHGGNGGSVDHVAGGAAYGSLLQPVTAGSGGGNGGAGGGVIRLQVAGTLRVDGAISANGLNGPSNYSSGGGAGGSIWLTVGSLTGGGLVAANGGQGNGEPGRTPGAGGSGGRIAIEYGTNTMPGPITATGGSGHQRGGAGTIYRKAADRALGSVLIDNGGTGGAYTPLSTPEPFDLTIANHASVHPTAALTVGNLRIAAEGELLHLSGQTGLDTTALGDATVETGGAISADGRGYGAGSGPGAGIHASWSMWFAGSGAGHGGNGGSVDHVAGGAAYGSLLQPVTAGSGGGNGGAGGGVIRLQVAGTLRVDGAISANGLNGPSNYSSGGGSGGSIWLTVGSLTGGGLVAANGGQGNGEPGRTPGAGGSGGRIAIEYGTYTMAGSVAATGGAGHQRGGAGTIYRKAANQALGGVLIDNGGTGGAYTPLSTPEPFDLTIANHGYVAPTAALTVGNLNIASNGVLFPVLGQPWLDVTALADVTVGVGGFINANGRGYGPNSGPGAGSRGERGYRYVGSGAGHGGSGGSCGTAGAGAVYDSEFAPTLPGSGGGSASGSTSGGAGGGVVRMNVAGTLRVDGQFTANGSNAAPETGSGGGSGGSVWLTVGTLVGTGNIAAAGGQGTANDRYTGGGGGGGRIAIYQRMVSEPAFAGLGASGGGGDAPGQPGTIYLAASLPPLEVISFDPAGTLKQAVGSAEVGFNQAVRGATFTPEDVVISTPRGPLPAGDVTVTPLGAAGFRIGFPPQTTAGVYQIQIGPHLENLYGQEMAAAYSGGFTIANPVISGFAKRADGSPMAHVLVSAGEGLSTSTDAGGAYALAVPPGWSGTVTPALPGWTFTPANRTYPSLTADASPENFSMALTEAATLILTRSGPTLQFGWPSAVGLRYQLQSSPTLLPGSWTDEGPPFDGTGSPLSTSLPVGQEPDKFFRLKID